MNQCPFCKGPVEERKVEHLHRWKERLFLLRNVPAEVCTQCGEVFFAPPALKAMDGIVASDLTPEEHVSIPVFSL